MSKQNKLPKNQTERIWAYLTPEEKQKLNIRLAVMDVTLSEWVRSLVVQFLEMPMPNDTFE